MMKRAVHRFADAWVRMGAGATVPARVAEAVAAAVEPAVPAAEREDPRGGRGKARGPRDLFLVSRGDVPSTSAAAAFARSDKREDERPFLSPKTKRSRSRKRSKKRRSRTTSRSSSSGRSRSIFRDASSRTSSAPASVMVSTKPGELYAQTIGAIMKEVQARGGAGRYGARLQRFLTYLPALLHGRNPHKKRGARTATELRLGAECLGALWGGDLTQVADLLVARFTSLEASAIDGHWETARHLDAISSLARGLETLDERKARFAERRFVGRGFGKTDE